MEIDDSSSLLHTTYYMVNWDDVAQKPSKTKCMQCGGPMLLVEPVKDKKGAVFEGLVCHKDKTVLWARKKA